MTKGSHWLCIKMVGLPLILSYAFCLWVAHGQDGFIFGAALLMLVAMGILFFGYCFLGAARDWKHKFFVPWWYPTFRVIYGTAIVFLFIHAGVLVHDSIKMPIQIEKKRVGNIAHDGTVSNATGSGAASSHGGVKEWIYEEFQRPMTEGEAKQKYLDAKFFIFVAVMLIIGFVVHSIPD